ncbi:uncharacterized protein LOC119401879 [Rhipicephalus sanguineus]|uniref:uncharacterized protein LOC119401879 n=1 Tax=Rhipicephalus sanguineus TaxID=34632 RepID=UPI0020C1EDDF|nr:uncharacterized protein LOC119401879 [Rhipicephalus sanguineus]
MVSLSASETLIRWGPPPKVSGFLTGYTIQTCHTFALCDADESVRGCIEHHTSEASLQIQTKADTPYCILVIAIARCGLDTISSPPAAQQIWTPLFALPDVENLRLVSAGNHAMTVTWDRPQAQFDYYRIIVTAGSESSDGSSGRYSVGSCGNGTIIHPDQNRVTCGYLEACSSVTFRMSTYRKGPTQLMSSDTSLQDILIPGDAPDSPRNITIETEAPTSPKMKWESPTKFEGVLGEYIVKVCKTYAVCTSGDTMWNCTEYRTSSTGLQLNGTSVPFCVLVTATSQCGTDILVSHPLATEATAFMSAHLQRQLFQWVAWDGDIVPKNAVPGGQDKYGVIYICRAKHHGDVIPGKLVSWHKRCYIAYDGAEHGYEEFEVFLNEETPAAVEWVPVFNCSLPSGIVQGGITYGGIPLYIGRTNHSGRLNIGKVVSSDGCLYIPYYSKEHRYTEYEALVVEYVNN